MTTTDQVASGSSMNVLTPGQARVVIVGATGMVGGYAVRYALMHPTIGSVTAIGRRKLGISHPKLKEVLHQNFADFSALVEELSGQNAAIFCLGTYTGTVPDVELRTITVDYTIEFARVLRGSSPDAAFSLLSGKGADPTGRSRLAFARYKGEAENALLAAGFPRVYIFRPAYIYPVEPRKEPNFSYRLMRAIYPVFRVLFPNQAIRADDLGRAMSPSGKRGSAEARFSRTVTSEPWSSRITPLRGISMHPFENRRLMHRQQVFLSGCEQTGSNRHFRPFIAAMILLYRVSQLSTYAPAYLA